MDLTCRQFLRLLKKAQDSGDSTNVFAIAKKIPYIPNAATPLDVFDICKNAGWVMGNEKAAWLTNEGRRKADDTN